MRQSFVSKIEDCFDLLKKEGIVDIKGNKYRSILEREIKWLFSKLEQEDFEKWTKLNIGAIDTKYAVDVILRVEFIMLSLFRLHKKENINFTLNDYKCFLMTPLLPHNKVYSQESNLIESSLRLYFSKSWGYDSVILRDFNHYFLLKEVLDEGFLWIDVLPGTSLGPEFMNVSLFSEDSPIIWTMNTDNRLKTIRKQIYSRIILSRINHNVVDVSPSEFMLENWFPDDNEKSVYMKFAAKKKDGDYIEIKNIYNSVIKNKYRDFKDAVKYGQAAINVARKKNIDIEINVEELLDFVSEVMQANEPNKNWLDRAKAINFYNVLLEERTKTIKIKDINHWIGLPNVGKTTIMNILSAYLSIRKNLKVAMILRENSDVSSSVDTLIKCGVKAVPFIGITSQEDHFKKRFNALGDVYEAATDNVLPFYSNDCQIKSILELEARDDVSKEDFCYKISYFKKDIRKNKDAEVDGEITYKGSLSCPYIMECNKYKSRQNFSETQVYITNIQSLIKTITKKTIFKEQVTSYELLLKECDVILIDEADNMLDTIDSFFIDEEFIVEGIERGTLELILDEVERESHGKKANHRDVTKWLRAARHCKSTAELILHMITDGLLPKTIVGNPFTSRSVFKYLAYRLIKASYIGCDDEDENTILDINDEYVEFEELKLNEKQLDLINYYKSYIDNFVQGYSDENSFANKDNLLNRMMQASTAVFYAANGDFHVKSEECFNELLVKFDIKLKTEKVKEIKRLETFKNLFKFAMMVTTFEVLYSYTQKNIDCCRSFIKNEELINKTGFANPFYKHYDGLIPLAAGIGKYGLSYEDDNGRKSLKIKKYLNVGRYLLYEMPKVFKNIDLTDTARTVFLSATSYMPYSPNYHIDVEPDYILENEDVGNLKINYKKMFLYDEDGNIIKFSGCAQEYSDKVLEFMAKDLCTYDKTNPESIPKITKMFNTTLRKREKMAFTVGSFKEAISFAHALKRNLSENGLSGLYRLCVIDSSESREGHNGIDVFVKANLDKFSDSEYNVAIIVTKSLERGVNILTEVELNKYVAAFSTLVYLKRPYLVPNNLNDLAAILNSYSLKMYMKTFEEACEYLGGEYSIAKYMHSVIGEVNKLEDEFYNRTYYRFIKDDSIRNAILANILVLTHQLEGRFYRGNVPATIIFADGSFFPEEAKGNRQNESYKTSIIEGFKKYFDDLKNDTSEAGVNRYKLIEKLYGFRIKALSNIEYLY